MRIPTRVALCVVVTLALAPPARAGVEVLVERGAVTVRAESVPLADVLDAVAARTGMQVLYESQRPQQVVTAHIVGNDSAQAVLQLLEGQGLNYALAMDGTGTRAATLLVSGPAADAARRPPPTALPDPEPDADPFASEAPPPDAPPGANDPDANIEAPPGLEGPDAAPAEAPRSPFTPGGGGPLQLENLPRLAPGGRGGAPAVPTDPEQRFQQNLERFRRQREQGQQSNSPNDQ